MRGQTVDGLALWARRKSVDQGSGHNLTHPVNGTQIIPFSPFARRRLIEGGHQAGPIAIMRGEQIAARFAKVPNAQRKQQSPEPDITPLIYGGKQVGRAFAAPAIAVFQRRQ